MINSDARSLVRSFFNVRTSPLLLLADLLLPFLNRFLYCTLSSLLGKRLVPRFHHQFLLLAYFWSQLWYPLTIFVSHLSSRTTFPFLVSSFPPLLSWSCSALLVPLLLSDPCLPCSQRVSRLLPIFRLLPLGRFSIH